MHARKIDFLLSEGSEAKCKILEMRKKEKVTWLPRRQVHCLSDREGSAVETVRWANDVKRDPGCCIKCP